MVDFVKQLNTQLDFIKRSCDGYDKGYTDESLRIAVSLRVLFHDTKNSISLLNHLNKKDSVRVISTFVSQESMASRNDGITWHTVLPLMLTSNGVKPPESDWQTISVLPLDKWWDEKIWVEGQHSLSRRDIILSAANQDGGAHVDGKPSATTQKLKVGPTITVKINGQDVENCMSNHHHPLIRQIGYEVLNSSEITQLAEMI